MSDSEISRTEADVWSAHEAQNAETVAAILAEMTPKAQADAKPAAPAPADVSLDAPQVPPTAETAPEVPASDPSDRGTLRLLEREGAIRDREAAVDKAERAASARVTELEAKLKSLESRVIPDDLEAAIASDPVDFFKSRGVDPAQVSRLILGGMLGKEAPREIQDAIKEYRYEKRIREMEARLAARDDEAEIAKVRSSVSEFTAVAKGDPKYPALAAVATKDPKKVTDAIFGKIAEDARTRGLRRGDKLMSHEEAAKAVDAEWSVFRDAFAAPAAAASTPPPAATPVAKAGTPAPLKVAPPPKRRPWEPEDRDAEVQAAIDEALAIAKSVTK